MSDKEWSDPNKVGGKYMAGVIADFAPALREIAKLGSMNNKPNGKYERGSWKLVNNPEVEYSDAFWRHLLEGSDNIDPESNMPHDVAIAWNAIVLVWFRLKREAEEALKDSPQWSKADLDKINPVEPTEINKIATVGQSPRKCQCVLPNRILYDNTCGRCGGVIDD